VISEELVVDPAEVGMSQDLLRRIERLLWEDVAAGTIPGASVAVARAGKLVYCSCVGYLDQPSETPMPLDAIFRIYSMSKPILSVATLSLVEDGRLELDAPVSRYLSELGDARVAELRDDGVEQLVPAEREPTVFDLLRHTSGISGGVYDSPLVAGMYAERGIFKYDHTPAAFTESLDDLVSKLAELPLSFHPGTRWEYGRSGDVLGRVLEVVTGQSLDEVFRERVFDPLDMGDSGFWVEPEAADRLAEPLRTDGARTPEDLIQVTRKPLFLSGGSGCVSSLGDFLRFSFALLGRGEVGGRRVLPEPLADLMVSDQIGPLAGTDPDFFPGGGYGFGMGLAVRTSDAATTPGSIGDYYWLARSSASFFVDPQEELVGVLMMQRFWLPRHYQRWFKTLVYAALTE
jgi:CubicO group peptidase (beta-lactamase class C family)